MSRLSANIAGEEARRIIAASNERGLALRLLGGVGIYLHCSKGIKIKELEREYVDLDFIGLSKDVPKITKLFVEMGYEPHKRFNAIMGSQRLLFSSKGIVDHIDVLLDELRMCHSWDLRKRIGIDPISLPLSDLLISKLQVVNITEKDLKDVIMLLLNHDLGPSEQEQVNTEYLAGLLGNDWGLWRTVTINLEKMDKYLHERTFEQRDLVLRRVDALKELAYQTPKSIAWKLRGVIGERVKWYDLPEDVER